jgi:hypothetical protein
MTKVAHHCNKITDHRCAPNPCLFSSFSFQPPWLIVERSAWWGLQKATSFYFPFDWGFSINGILQEINKCTAQFDCCVLYYRFTLEGRHNEVCYNAMSCIVGFLA